MKTFYCDHCSQLIYFENTECLNCGHILGFCPDTQKNTAFEATENGLWKSLAPRSLGKLYKKCLNYSNENVCNWMIPVTSTENFCLSCRLNQTIPDIHVGDNRKYWYKLEQAKRRLIYSILRLKLPLKNRKQDPENGLVFEFLEGPELSQPERSPVSTGHNKGLITINVAEANDAVRVKLRLEMKEMYRTLLGHFRHEIGHYYWFTLVQNSKWLDTCREIFGDDRLDYQEALSNYYATQTQRQLHPDYISVYASSHPWEDWAETWAHYMHIYDTLETAYSWKINFNPKLSKYPKKDHDVEISTDESFNEMLTNWSWATGALNSLNRSMGLNDPYPFIVTAKVSDKLRFIHKVIHES